jgi:hypothetical protein
VPNGLLVGSAQVRLFTKGRASNSVAFNITP